VRKHSPSLGGRETASGLAVYCRSKTRDPNATAAERGTLFDPFVVCAVLCTISAGGMYLARASAAFIASMTVTIPVAARRADERSLGSARQFGEFVPEIWFALDSPLEEARQERTRLRNGSRPYWALRSCYSGNKIAEQDSLAADRPTDWCLLSPGQRWGFS